MAEFHDTDGGFSSMTEAELDAIALAGGRLCSIGYGYACRGKPETRHGYTFTWIGTRGMGNYGRAVLRGLTFAKRELIRVGKATMIAREHGCSFDTAAAIVAVGHLEHGVVALALRERHNPIWQTFPGVGNGVWNWVADYAVDSGGLSAPRLGKVAAIIDHLQRSMADSPIYV